MSLIQWYGPEIGTPYDSTHIYRSTSNAGPWTLVATVTPITTTSYFDTGGTSSSWYQIAFYDSVGLFEGPMSAPFYAGSTATFYTSVTELRKFMQFDPTDFPNDEDATLLLEQAHVQLNQDVVGISTITDPGKLRLLALLLGASFVCRSLASRALSKGYISVSLEGANIMKAHDALMRLSEYYYEKYQAQLAKDTIDYTTTSFMTPMVDDSTAQDIIDTMNGVTDALDYQSQFLPSIKQRTAR